MSGVLERDESNVDSDPEQVEYAESSAGVVLTTDNIIYPRMEQIVLPNQIAKERPVLRQYQQRIVDQVKDQSAVIVLPTGAGKTRIISEIINQSMNTRDCIKSLILVPTVVLVKLTESKKTWSIRLINCTVKHSN